ncbi:MAG TPA: class I SAM-dependent methyltransferase [Candidatus Methanoperedens sp.]|nr:class I SAM-dependent methyltransferase [Candidatus Methanoperedens sp.]
MSAAPAGRQLEQGAGGVRGAKCFDASRARLVFLREPATADFWDAQWLRQAERDHGTASPRRGTLVTRTTARHLPRGARILEGGCGTGVNSRCLLAAGYRVTALDFAPGTIAWLGQRAPQINPVLGDVRALPFANGSFDGYWSLGVIEHFFEGYAAARDEMRRVLRPGGMLFLTYPYLNPLRRARLRSGKYPPWDEAQRERFYQCALDHRRVAAEFAAAGFVLVEQRPHLGLSGAEDLWPRLERPFGRLRAGGRLARWGGAALNALLEPFTSHLMLLVLRRT